MKVRSIEEFKKGETIKIFELNGVTSDAGHIYDKDYTLIKAYKDIVKEMNFIYKISVLNIKNGVKPIRAGFMIPFIFNYFKKQNYTEHFLWVYFRLKYTSFKCWNRYL